MNPTLQFQDANESKCEESSRGANHYVFPVIITFFPQDYGITFFLHKLRFLKILIVCIKHAL